MANPTLPKNEKILNHKGMTIKCDGVMNSAGTYKMLSAPATLVADPASMTGVALTGTLGETADTVLQVVDTAVGAGAVDTACALKADVDARLDLINKNFADLQAQNTKLVGDLVVLRNKQIAILDLLEAQGIMKAS